MAFREQPGVLRMPATMSASIRHGHNKGRFLQTALPLPSLPGHAVARGLGPSIARCDRQAADDGPSPPPRANVLRDILYVVCRVKAGDLSGCDSRPANWSLQPVAIGAIEEVTNRLKPLMHTVALGDFASMQTVT